MSCADGMGLSIEQAEALLDDRPRVLVAAGAGSGKTRSLVAYFVRALVDDGVPVEQLAAVTFTRKAAAELTARIRAALEECGRSDLARSLDAATIGTIHGLCRRLIKERALEAGVDPAFSVLEAEAARLLKDEASRGAWEQVLRRTDDAGLEVVAHRRDALRREMVTLYDRLRGAGHEHPQVIMPPKSGLEHARIMLVEAVRDALEAGDRMDHTGKSLVADLERLRQCLRWLEAPVRLQTSEWLEAPERLLDIQEELEATLEFFPSRRTSAMEPWFEPVRCALTGYRGVLAERLMEPLVRTMNDLLAEFHQEYEGRKRERGLLDFADLELRAMALVGGDGDGSEPARNVPFARVLVDEFQDTNELQCGILDKLGAPRMVMVGDERQSIYRFRGADVAVFRRREDDLEAAGAGSRLGGLHRLDVNYRSRPEILDFLNRLFAHQGFFGTRHSLLRKPGPREGYAPRDEHPAVEVLVARRQCADADESAPLIQEAEAVVVADRIRRLIDEEGWSKRDIVVLLPAQTHVDRYRQALVERGVEVYLVRGKGYYSREEVADVTGLLRLLVNPHDDLALVGVLRSPLVGMSDDGLYLLGQEGRKRRSSLWDTVRGTSLGSLSDADRRSLAEFGERLERLRRRVGRPGLARLIDDAVTACDYDVCLLASPEGKRRFANVRKLMRMAEDYETLRGPDLAGFVDIVRSMGDLSDTEGSAPTLAEGEDVVRVMTVHQSKGLEFPVVVLAGLGSDVPSGRAGEVAVADDGRVGVFLKGSRHKNYEAHDLSWGPAVEILEEGRVKDREEDVRLLYVAMTRAEQRLLLVGSTSADGDLGKCRLGRIAGALGLDHIPGEGEDVRLPGLDVVVSAVGPPPIETPGSSRAEGNAASEQEPCPDPAGDRIAVAARSIPQFPDALPGGAVPRRVSFSALAAYQRCPRMFYLERVLGLGHRPETGGDDRDAAPPGESLLDEEERHAGREVGLLVHALLERTSAGAQAPSEQALRILAQEWIAKNGSRLGAGARQRAVTLARALWDSPVAALLSRSGVEREADRGVEREVEFFFEQDGTIVTGVMDLLCRSVEPWQIVDYKTNSLNGRSPAELAAAYDLQAKVYCLAALKAGAPSVRLDLVFLERPQEPVTVLHDEDDMALLKGSLDRALEGLRQGEFAPNQGAACRICLVAGVCTGMAGP